MLIELQSPPDLWIYVLAFALLILPLILFAAWAAGQNLGAPPPAPEPRCENCQQPLVPLLDATHVYRGEAACASCGHFHEGVAWPDRDPPATAPASSKARPNA